MQVLSLYLLFGLNFHTIEHSQLGDVKQHLKTVQFLVHDRVEAEFELSEEWELLDIAELSYFVNLVQR